MRPDAILLSPGPCTPNEAGICLPLIGAAAAARVPLMGVCLGLFYVLDRETGRPISAGATTPPAATTAPSLLPRANPAAGLQL